MSWFLGCFKKYAVFQGRARRKEYWMFTLFSSIINLIFGIIIFSVIFAPLMEFIMKYGNDTYTLEYQVAFNDLIKQIAGFYIAFLLYNLAIFIPTLAVTVRRLHDIGKSGWWYFIQLIPCYIGTIWFIVLMATEGIHGENQYGPDPKDPNPTNEFIPT